MNKSMYQMNFSKPKTLVCYICGRQFGTKSLSIHLKSCKQKFDIQQKNKQNRNLRIKLPPTPQILTNILNQIERGNFDEQSVQKYNSQALQIYKYSILPSCQYCGRTFNQQSLLIHLKACQKNKNSSKTQLQSSYNRFQQFKKPRTLMCCVCGRQFGLTSLKIHYPQCQQNFKIEQSKKKANQRQKAPQFSKQQQNLVNNKEDWTLQEINQFNQNAQNIYRNRVLVQCSNCKRKFLPDSYKKHLKNCKMINGNLNPLGQQKQKSGYPNFEDIKKPRVLMCYICGRQFGLNSLKIHLKSCIQKFHNQQQKKPKKQRRQLPELNLDQNEFDINNSQNWPLQKINHYNSIVDSIYKNVSLYSCMYCGRKFFEDALKRHLNYCQKQAEKNGLNQVKNNQKKSPIKNNKSSLSLQKSKLSVQKQKDKDFLPQEGSISKQKQRSSKNIKKQPTKEIQNDKNTIKDNNKIKANGFENNNSDLTKQKLADKNQKSQKNIKKEEDSKDQIVQTSFIKKGDQLEASKLFKSSEMFFKGKQISNSTIKQVNEDLQQTFKQKRNQNNQIRRQNPIQQRYNKQIQTNIPKIQQQDQISIQRVECSKCGRKFAQDRIQKHQSICKNKKKNIDQNIKQVEKHKKINNQNATQQQHKQQKLKQFKQLKNQKKIPQYTQYENQTKQNNFTTQSQINKAQNQLKQCQKCGKKFMPSKLQKHMAKCKDVVFKKLNKKNTNETKPQEQNSSNQLNQIQQTISQYKKQQDQIKQNSWLQKQRIKQNPTNQKRQKSSYKIDNVNNDQNELPSNLKECKYCKRKFNQDRIQKHQNVCNKKKAQQQAEQQKNRKTLFSRNKRHINKNQSQEGNKEKQFNKKQEKQQNQVLNLAKCKICQRSFNQDRIQKHQSICKNYKFQAKNGYQVKEKEPQSNINQVKTVSNKKLQPLKIDPKQSQNKFKKQALFQPEQFPNYTNTPQASKKNLFNIKTMGNKKQSNIKNKIVQPIEQKIRQIKQNNQNKNGSEQQFRKSNINKIFKNQKQKQKLNDQPQENLNSKSLQKNELINQQESIKRIACRKCDRKFAQDRIQKHQNICKFTKPTEIKPKKDQFDIKPKKNQLFSSKQKNNLNNIDTNNLNKNNRINTKKINQQVQPQKTEEIFPRKILSKIKQIKKIVQNQSAIDRQIQMELDTIAKIKKENKNLQKITRNTYGGGQKFYTRKINKIQPIQNKPLDLIEDDFQQIILNQDQPKKTKNFRASKDYLRISKQNIKDQQDDAFSIGNYPIYSPKVAMAKKWQKNYFQN